MLDSSPSEPRWLVLVTEDTCTFARYAVLVKTESKSLTAVPAFKQLYLLWDSVLRCLKHVISQAMIIRLKMQLDHATISSRGQKQMPQGQGKEQSMYVVVLPLTLCPWSSPVAQGFPGRMCWRPAAFIKATVLPGRGCA